MIFARAAITNPRCKTVPAERVAGLVLADCCSWREVEVRYRAVVRLAHLDGFHPELLDEHPWLGGSA